jgi:hypothetical protein
MKKLTRKREHGKAYILPNLLARELTPKTTLRSNLENNGRDETGETKRREIKASNRLKAPLRR